MSTRSHVRLTFYALVALSLFNYRTATLSDRTVGSECSTASELDAILKLSARTDEQNILCSQEMETTIFKDPSPVKPFEACFVSSIFGMSVAESDKPFEAHPWLEKFPNHGFFMYTNLIDLEAPGWRKVLYFNKNFRRMVTQSRYPKWLAWKSHIIQTYCPVVYYLDGSSQPTKSLVEFRALAQLILKSSVGLAQSKHAVRDLRNEMRAIVKKRRDTKANMDATRKWLEKQPDFSYDCQLYANTHFGYNPKNRRFQEATEYFWTIYSQEKLSWRDQPIWCYTLAHLNVTPVDLHHFFNTTEKQQGGRLGGHRYDESTNTEAVLFLERKRHLCLTLSEQLVGKKGKSQMNLWDQCVPLTDEQERNLAKEIKVYEQSTKFENKINQVKASQLGPQHQSIALFLKQNVLRPNWSVLELGCAAGAMLQVVKKLYGGGIGMHKEIVGVELVTGWVKFADEFFRDQGIQVFEGDVTDFQLPRALHKKTFDFVMLNDVAEHIQKNRYGCLFQKLREVTHDGSIVYFHTPNPQTQLHDAKEQYYENVLPHHVVVSGMAASNFELVTFEQDVYSKCERHRTASSLPKSIQATQCAANGYPKYYHAVFRRVDRIKVFDLE